MVDVLTPEQRKRCMRNVKRVNTDIEIALRKALWRVGIRYRLNYKLPGKPDLVLVGRRLAIFVDGCYWHGCPIHGQISKTNEAFWRRKINGNITRDAAVNSKLSSCGWQVLRFWEHEIKQDLDSCVHKVELILNKV